jgi:peptidoglycan/LPS O-acetylase OafA/YrhL
MSAVPSTQAADPQANGARTQVKTTPHQGKETTAQVKDAQASGRSQRSSNRLAWLDALRGVAALCVVFSHLSTYVLQPVHNDVYDFFDPGLYGVLVFFMVSGYIVPASLERKGSIRSFWVSRVFRLFPLFIVAIGGVIVLHDLGYASARGTTNNISASVFAHAFMLGDMLGGSDVISVLWTLSYEMVFYLLLTALFTAGLHRRSDRLATGFAAAALLLGGILPTCWLSHTAGYTKVAVTADILVLGGLALAVAGNRVSRTVGAWVAATTGLVLLTVNEREFAYEGLTILALMFTGTLLYRAEHGQVSRGRAAVITAAVFAAVIGAGAWHIPALTSSPIEQRLWLASVPLAGLTFALGMALRKRRVPAAVAWLGLISYSVYLLHWLLIDGYDAIPATHGSHPLWMQFLMAAGYFAALLICCSLTYYLVEVPMQRLGRRLAARLEARFGSDRMVTAGLARRLIRVPPGAQRT